MTWTCHDLDLLLVGLVMAWTRMSWTCDDLDSLRFELIFCADLLVGISMGWTYWLKLLLIGLVMVWTYWLDLLSMGWTCYRSWQSFVANGNRAVPPPLLAEQKNT